MFEYQARAFLDEVVGNTADPLPANATFDDGVHNMEVLDAVARSAADGGATVDLAATAGVHA
jgi:predicted dehydrogenase